MRGLFGVSALLMCIALRSLSAEEAPQPILEIAEVSSISWIPIVGYNPTYLFFAGGGFFLGKKDSREFGIHGIVTQQGVFKIEANSEFHLSQKWRLRIDDEVSKGYEPNYGAGGQTRVEDRVDVPMSRNAFEMRLTHYPTHRFSVGALVDYRIRRNQKGTLSAEDLLREKDPASDREDTLGFGLAQGLDFRDRTDSPSFGWYQNFTARLFPSGTQRGDSRTFGLVDADIRMYQYIFNQDLVLAYQLAGGIAFGVPSNSTEYKLGGTDRLRGFYENRFRGSRFYLQQSELRFPIFKAVGGATFIEFGEAENFGTGRPSLSYGLGVRVGLPPDYMKKVRLDVAFSRDQSGIFLDFGHAF